MGLRAYNRAGFLRRWMADAKSFMTDSITQWLAAFPLHDALRPHVAEVLFALPLPVRDDLLGDPGFSLCDYDPRPGRMMLVPVGSPGQSRPGRSVVLKRTLALRPGPFVRWVIAHELAHAHLRNAGRWPGDDPEHAADALAAEWGFPRPGRG